MSNYIRSPPSPIPREPILTILIQIQTMRIGRLIQCFHRFSTGAGQNPYEAFLASTKKELTIKRNPGRSNLGTEVHVPHARVSREAVQAFFENKQIKNKNVLLNVDSSHLLGMRRAVSLQYMGQNVYKGNSDPVDILKKRNPSKYLTIDQLALDQGVFAFTDPIFIEKARKQSVTIQSLLPEIQAYYQANLDRGVERFYQEYRIPPQFLYIIETAHNLGNRVYFAGLNQFELREIVASYLSLVEVKILFMECLKYSAKQSLSDIQFQHRNKDLLWQMHYTFLQPINYQLLQKMRQQVKGYCFAHAHNFIQPPNNSINFRGMRDKEPDNTKLEKHAILSILFGDIWTKPYTNDPFPYLAQPYSKLSAEDKALVVEVYNTFYNKYKAASEKFRSEVV